MVANRLAEPRSGANVSGNYFQFIDSKAMRQIITKFLISSVLICLSLSASAYDFEVDGLYYSVISDSEMTCAIVAGDNEYEGDITIPSEVTYNNHQYAVTVISWWAFNCCSALTSVTIGNSVTEIRAEAFFACRSLTSVTIPNSVTEIGASAFYGCESLISVYYNSENPIESDNGNIFYNALENATLYVPAVAVEKCKVISPWKDFKNIVAYDFSGVETVSGAVTKTVTGRYDLSGSAVDGYYRGMVIEQYSDGSTMKTLQK